MASIVGSAYGTWLDSPIVLRVRADPHWPLDDLTPTQLAVAELVREGRSYAEIADHLGVSLSAVKCHISALMRCLRCHDHIRLLLLLQVAELPT